MNFHFKWTLKDAIFTKDKGTIFSCFACGGGSTMGYKLAGFDVLGCNEIDKKLMEAYKINHNPKYSYCEPIQTFKLRNDLPEELYNLDILDGSPPCSSFSISGNREKDWGKEKKFREGQALQILDTLFFDFIELAKKLQPKIIVAENVKGLLIGEAKKYVYEINKSFNDAGYIVQIFVLNSKNMGVPQSRERVFFIALRNDLCEKFLWQKTLFSKVPKLILKFDEPVIKFKEIYQGESDENLLTGKIKKLWENKNIYDKNLSLICKRIYKKESFWSHHFIFKNKTVPTITATNKGCLWDEPRKLSKRELILSSTFPGDYDFLNNSIEFVVGMSVPPLMMAKIAEQIHKQWLSKL